MYVLLCVFYVYDWEVGKARAMFWPAACSMHKPLFVFVTSNEVHAPQAKAEAAKHTARPSQTKETWPCCGAAATSELLITRVLIQQALKSTLPPSTSLPLLLRLCALVSCSFWKTRYNSSFIASGVCTSSRTPPSTQRYSRTHTSRAPHNTGAGGNHKRTRAASLNRISITQTRTGRGKTSIARS